GGSNTSGAGGAGGSNTGGDATGGAGGAGTGGAGGTQTVTTGEFNMSNTMSNIAQSAAGVSVISQNNGFSSLIQQSVNVQSNMTVGGAASQ
ncbi:hypothetical protein J8847_23770, partial [Massilia sp. AB1]|nr:hypothetical protein [Massilia sp. AB1]